MIAAGALPLRLAPRTPAPGGPAGLALPAAALPGLAARLLPRAAFYPALRLALCADVAVLFAAEPGPLPWHAEPICWLDADGPLLFAPSGHGLDAPPALRPEVARRLLQRHGLDGPAALLPPRVPGGPPRLLDLAASRALAEVDLARLAAP